MTNSELIEELKKYPPGAEVKIHTAHRLDMDIVSIYHGEPERGRSALAGRVEIDVMSV